MSRKPILVTGSHRSGTTWVGKMIATSPEVGYIHEPFNSSIHRPGICNVDFPAWFTYITTENEAPFYNALKDTISFHFNLQEGIKACTTLKDSVRLVKDFSSFTVNRLYRNRALLKDPIAVFSAEWLAQRFSMDVVLLVRHPAAFISSVQRLNWGTDFSQFLIQPLLMRDYLSPFAAEITAFAKHEHDILDQAILVWKIIHYVILKYRNTYHDEWYFLRHEDIARDPLSSFEYIFKRLQLDFSKQVKLVIQSHSTSSNLHEKVHDHTDIKRDSRSIIKGWKKKFTPAELLSIRNAVEEISQEFYSDSDW